MRLSRHLCRPLAASPVGCSISTRTRSASRPRCSAGWAKATTPLPPARPLNAPLLRPDSPVNASADCPSPPTARCSISKWKEWTTPVRAMLLCPATWLSSATWPGWTRSRPASNGRAIGGCGTRSFAKSRRTRPSIRPREQKPFWTGPAGPAASALRSPEARDRFIEAIRRTIGPIGLRLAYARAVATEMSPSIDFRLVGSGWAECGFAAERVLPRPICWADWRRLYWSARLIVLVTDDGQACQEMLDAAACGAAVLGRASRGSGW